MIATKVALENLEKRRLGVMASQEGLATQANQDDVTPEILESLVQEAKLLEKRTEEIKADFASLREFVRTNLPKEFHLKADLNL